MDKIFCKETLDSSLNSSAQLTETVTQALSALSDIEKYCLKERYLHGKSQLQLAEKFRKIWIWKNLRISLRRHLQTAKWRQ